MARQPPAEFLPAQPPANAQCHRIDFTRSDPPLPEYKDLRAVVIDNALTKEECDELLRLAEASTVPPHKDRSAAAEPTWERAMINLGNGKQALAVDTRNCGRIIYDAPALADKLLARLRPFLQELGLEVIDRQPRVTGLAGRNAVYRLTRLNERLRFLKYEGGEYFRPHWDGKYRTPDGGETSYYTVHLYLNGEGEQDRKELMREMKRVEEQMDKGEGQGAVVNLDPSGRLLGGATSFLPRFEEKERHLRVFPRTGSVLVFQQNDLLHGGDPVLRGVKYTMRTDIMYRRD
ncbi:uncharacterized protein BO97DRAFT_403187 [Aspergillus homomorphus CBS 101889]|uniref:Prolyl 4-hydroxylase alpha subunit domain-containing protein n=1 Tax=Aspergillus homomorphus (strain CBS 101889) TaxID=1450537 RepID=A0A395I878_ASPHC|nr:hypothetical protein BO97DRAFT_403187 [Aspergillus homomorphus CBS 101889]RAL16009.1 hypothetical protein BO97DRAFT_403187 [Aspergillus homomorphus CBS 101889]